ncbi:protein Mis18-beta [Amazona aestiva]|uniref:Protein Mis18-beta n=1 Tax=Amazona aestiva TaxID=12930 RepID=A0A0Q3RHQ6_AMAAE|nr:protein Mis18-beta [Amazona aestiva]
MMSDAQPSGVIVVERPPAAAAPVQASPPASRQAAGLVSVPPRQGLLLEPCAVFQCRGCWTVLSDSLQLCEHEERLGFLVCYSQYPPRAGACYLLKSQIIVEASKMIFPPDTLGERLLKLKEKLVETHTRIESLMKTVKELEEKNNGQKGRALHQMQLGY